MRIAATLVVAACLGAQPVPAEPPSEAARSEMAKLSPLAGKWKGAGWRLGREGRSAFDSEETIVAGLDGRALIIEGRHYAAGTRESVHHALAILAWDAAAGEYRLHSALASGRTGSFPGRLEAPGRFVWTIQPANAPWSRFTMNFEEADRWVEVGEMSRDGGRTWTKILEMTLARER